MSGVLLIKISYILQRSPIMLELSLLTPSLSLQIHTKLLVESGRVKVKESQPFRNPLILILISSVS